MQSAGWNGTDSPWSWRCFLLDGSLKDQPDRLLASWRTLAPMLRILDPSRTVPEVVNEPVFSHNDAGWTALQHAVLAVIRGVLPANRIVLTGADWGSVEGCWHCRRKPIRMWSTASTSTNRRSSHRWGPIVRAWTGRLWPGCHSRFLIRGRARRRQAPPGTRRPLVSCDIIVRSRWDAEKLGARIAEAGDWARHNHANVIAGEFGASVGLRPDARMAWLARFRPPASSRALAGRSGVTTISMGFAARPPAVYRFDIGILTALGMSDSPVRK